MSDCRPGNDPTAPVQFVINAAAGSNAADPKREAIEAALYAAGRQGNLLFSQPADLAQVAHQAATLFLASRTAVVATTLPLPTAFRPTLPRPRCSASGLGCGGYSSLGADTRWRAQFDQPPALGR